jgi:hypothetical protein
VTLEAAVSVPIRLAVTREDECGRHAGKVAAWTWGSAIACAS